MRGAAEVVVGCRTFFTLLSIIFFDKTLRDCDCGFNGEGDKNSQHIKRRYGGVGRTHGGKSSS